MVTKMFDGRSVQGTSQNGSSRAWGYLVFVKAHQRLHCRGSTQHSGETAILCMWAVFFPWALWCCPESSWTKCMWRQKCRLYVGSATWISPHQGWSGYCFCWYLLVQQLKQNLSPWYELGLNIAKPGKMWPGKQMDSFQTTTASTWISDSQDWMSDSHS